MLFSGKMTIVILLDEGISSNDIAVSSEKGMLPFMKKKNFPPSTVG
jgi:hypothetical protein